ncbi:MAG: rod shape-determining protein MreC, partial [Patescibacteria group bacterium]
MKRIEFRFLFLSLFCILLGQWPRFQLWRRKGEDLLSPFRFGSYRASKSVSDVVSFWFTVGNLAEENAQLRKKVGDLEAFQAEIELLRVENDQLRDQVGLARRAGGELVAARVSGWEPFSNRRLMVIDKGLQEGIKV